MSRRCSLARLGPNGFDTTESEPLRVRSAGHAVGVEQLAEALASLADAPSSDKPPTYPRVRDLLIALAHAIVTKFRSH